MEPPYGNYQNCMQQATLRQHHSVIPGTDLQGMQALQQMQQMQQMIRPLAPSSVFDMPKPKLPWTYSDLITIALLSFPKKKMTTFDICAFIEYNYNTYCCYTEWMVVVRRDLHNNKRFIQLPIDKDHCLEGSYWAINPELKESVVREYEALNRLPTVPAIPDKKPVQGLNVSPMYMINYVNTLSAAAAKKYMESLPPMATAYYLQGLFEQRWSDIFLRFSDRILIEQTQIEKDRKTMYKKYWAEFNELQKNLTQIAELEPSFFKLFLQQYQVVQVNDCRYIFLHAFNNGYVNPRPWGITLGDEYNIADILTLQEFRVLWDNFCASQPNGLNGFTVMPPNPIPDQAETAPAYENNIAYQSTEQEFNNTWENVSAPVVNGHYGYTDMPQNPIPDQTGTAYENNIAYQSTMQQFNNSWEGFSVPVVNGYNGYTDMPQNPIPDQTGTAYENNIAYQSTMQQFNNSWEGFSVPVVNGYNGYTDMPQNPIPDQTGTAYENNIAYQFTMQQFNNSWEGFSVPVVNGYNGYTDMPQNPIPDQTGIASNDNYHYNMKSTHNGSQNLVPDPDDVWNILKELEVQLTD